MTSVTLLNGETVETGCHLDGHYGWRNTGRSILEIALPLGMTVSVEDLATLNTYQVGDDSEGSELVHDLADEAQDYLNSITPEGYIWHWLDGEFFLCTEEGYHTL